MKGTGTVLLALVLVGCRSDSTASVFEPEEPMIAATLSAGIGGSAAGSAHITYFGPPTAPGLGLRNFGFSAVTHANGTTTGQWQIVVGATILHGAIDCLVIAPGGSSARISGVVQRVKPANSSFFPGTSFAMELFDNGPGGSGDPDVSTQLLAFRNTSPGVGRTFCLTGQAPGGADLMPLPLEHGNFTIQIRD